ncbi:hypothetical protein O6H91_17G044000 [Diphasiastrum complanatum]|uniref:Uncharacterized protein n=1 Tax=Diphasiastrum complanatum TaxID=34168 RepID=A0ACC2B692_DIPCM|nr:hypothetical protein O6H91_17G044000 [Diphasiastrum complanatum]
MTEIKNWLLKVEEGEEGLDGRPSVGPTYRSYYAKDGFSKCPEGIHTCWDIFSHSVKKFPGNKFLGRREILNGKAGRYIWQTYKEVYDQVLQIGSAMRAVGMEPRDRCGVYGANCPEWMMTLEACNGHSIYCVPLYDTLGENAVEFIIGHAEVSIAFVQEAKLPAILKCLPKCAPILKTVVSFGAISNEQKVQAETVGVTAYSWEDFLELGRKHSMDPTPPKEEDICTIMYTSGTTGDPKGVLLTNQNIVNCIAGVDHLLSSFGEVMDDKDVYLSFLPLAHIFDRAVEEFFIYKGSSIGFWQGDVKLLVDDIAELKPTLFAGVPRVFERVYSGIQTKTAQAGGLKKAIFDFGYKHKLQWLKRGCKQDKASPLFDMLVFNKVKQGLGGRVRVVLSGAAPLAQHVEEFLRVVTCAYVVQGYGLTETCAASFITIPDVMTMQGTVGPPMPNIEVRLESVPELNYDARGKVARGEICIRGKTVFVGYHKRKDLTEEVLVDNWFHTGDIGEWQADGALKIIDRKKNIFKLSQGEYVAVENLENIYGLCSAIDSIWVYGNSFESVLVAVVVPNTDVLLRWARDDGEAGDFETLCESPKAKEFIIKELNIVAKKNGLKGFEYIKGVHLEPRQFDVERDLLTPTFKKKRSQLLKYYKGVIDDLYQSVRKP